MNSTSFRFMWEVLLISDHKLHLRFFKINTNVVAHVTDSFRPFSWYNDTEITHVFIQRQKMYLLFQGRYPKAVEENISLKKKLIKWSGGPLHSKDKTQGELSLWEIRRLYSHIETVLVEAEKTNYRNTRYSKNILFTM